MVEKKGIIYFSSDAEFEDWAVAPYATIKYIENSKIKMTVWQGKYENYYSDNGATYIDTKNKKIRSAYSNAEYDERTKKMMEVINNERK